MGNTSVEEYGDILDINTDSIRHVSDAEVRAFLQQKLGVASPPIILSLEKNEGMKRSRHSQADGHRHSSAHQTDRDPFRNLTETSN